MAFHHYYGLLPAQEAAVAGASGSPYTMVAASGSFALTGTAAGLAVGYKVAAANGAYTLSGTAAGLAHGYKIAAANGAYTLTGTAVTLTYSGSSGSPYTMAAASGSYALSGTAAGLAVGYKIAAGNGAYSLSGTAAGLVHGYTMPAGSAGYTLTGTAVTLSTTAAPATDTPQVYGGKVDDDWHHFKRKWDDEDEDAERKALAKARKAIEAVRVEVSPAVKTAPAPVRKAFVAPQPADDIDAFIQAIERQVERVRSARVMADRAYKAAATRYIAAMEAEAKRLQDVQDEMEEEEAIMSLLLDD